MKNFKKLTAILLAVATLALPAAAFAENRLEKVLRTGKLVVCIEPYFPPMEYLDNTKTGQESIRGADVELAKYIAKELGVELELVPLTFSAVLAGISQGKYDLAISALAWTPNRAKSLEMSNPYNLNVGKREGYSLLIRKADLDKYNVFSDFDGKLVGYHSGTLQEQLVEGQLPNVKRKTYDTLQNAVLALDAGKIEAVAVAIGNGRMFIAANPKLEILPGEKFVIEKDGACVCATKGEVEIIARIDEILAKLEETGDFLNWYNDAVEEAKKLGLK